MSETSFNQFYWTEIDGFPPLYELAETDGFSRLNYGPDLSPWIIYSPDWSKYPFAFLFDGRIVVCPGIERADVVKNAITDCLDTLFVSGAISDETDAVDSVETLELDAELQQSFSVDFSEDSSVTVDYDLRQEERIQETLTNGPVDVVEINAFDSDRPVPVAYGEEYVYLGNNQLQYSRSPDESCTVAYSRNEVFLFTAEKVTAQIQATSPTTACISNTGIAVIGGDLSAPGQSEGNEGSEELEIEFEVGGLEYDGPDEDMAVYSLYGEQLHSDTVSNRVISFDISDDGRYAAILFGTYETSQLRIYDVEDWEVLLEHETRDEHPSSLGPLKEDVQLRRTDAGHHAYLSETVDDDPTYAVDFDGNIVWKTDDLVLRENPAGLLTKIEHPDQSVSALTHNYESRSEAIGELETITSRHPEALEGHVNRLVTVLEQGKLSVVNERKETDHQSSEAGATTTLLFGNVGRAPQLIRPHLDTLTSLAQHSTTPTVKQAASDCLKYAAKESDEVSKALVPHLAPAFETAPVPVEVISIFETGLDEILTEKPNTSDTIAEQIRITTDIDEQKELFRVLKKNISLSQPEEVRAPLAAPVAEVYIDLVKEYASLSHDEVISSRSYASALHGDVKTVLERVIDTQPELFSDLTQPLLEQCLAASQATSHASPGDPSALLQIGCVLAESTVQEELIQARQKIDSVVHQTDEPAAVDILFCIGDEWAQTRLKELRTKSSNDDLIESRASRIRNRAETALQSPNVDKEIDPAIDELDHVATRTDTIRTNIDPLTERVMKFRLQYCYDHLQEVGSAMRSDFEQCVADRDQGIIAEFDTWWDDIRNGLTKLPDVQLNGHTYSYTSNQ